jgi:hypothetical protein
MPEIRVPELQHPDIANAVFRANADVRANKAMQMQEEIFKQEQDPMSTQNQLRKMQLEKVRGDILRDTFDEVITNAGAINWKDKADWEAFDTYYKQRFRALGFDLEAIPPAMRLTPIYKVGTNGVQSDTIDEVAMQKRVRELQENVRRMEAKPVNPTASIGAANLAYRMSKDAYDANKKEEENVDNLYRMITTNAEKPDLVRRDVRNFNKKSKDYEFVLRPQGKAYQTWFLPESAERFLGGTPPTYVAVPKGFTLSKVAELSELSGVTPEEFTEDAVTLMKEYKLTPAQVEKEIRTRYGKK